MSTVVTARINDETLARVDKAARAHGRSRAWFVARAVERAADEEEALLASLDDAESAIARGDFYTQDEMEAWFEAKVRARSQTA